MVGLLGCAGGGGGEPWGEEKEEVGFGGKR